MKIQAINAANPVNSKGNVVKPGKFANLAYSAIFATSLLTAADAFIPSNKEKQTPKTELSQKAGYDSDLLEELQRRTRENAERIQNEYHPEKKADEMTFKDYLIAIFAGAFIGGAARTVTNALKEG